MTRKRKYGRVAAALFALLLAAQIGVSALVRTKRMRNYLIAHLERAFGRPVEAGTFSVQILPIPELEMDGVTIGEAPGFGREYFLRAERLTASFGWRGLLGGHFEFGTMSLLRPSLILVRNAEGRWNLEDWLPPAGAKAGGAAHAAPQQVGATNRLQKIEFDQGRINFKEGNEKRPFAFTNVSGKVEQVAPGRWQLQLEAQPWRSGVALQSTGRMQVVGAVAGTSVRLQPAELRLHWDKVSLADLFRLVTGNDFGVRGQFALDASARVGTQRGEAPGGEGQWLFEVGARAWQIHRWDLTERSDNPRINLNVKGNWEVGEGQAQVEQIRVEMPRSNANGTARLWTGATAGWRIGWDQGEFEGSDLLAWYRAFEPGVAEEVSVDGRVKARMALSGWPVECEDGEVSTTGGTLRVPGLTAPVRIEPFFASVVKGNLKLGSLRVILGEEGTPAPVFEKTVKPPGKPHSKPNVTSENELELSLSGDSPGGAGELQAAIHLADSPRFFKLTRALGHPLNQGWEYAGVSTGLLALHWGKGFTGWHRTGNIQLLKGQLQVAGLNLPIKLEENRLEWSDGATRLNLQKAEAFDANWNGTIYEQPGKGADAQPEWRFELHADRLDGKELDRWFGPRARPSWLERLLPSLLGETNPAGRASELLRRVRADGELTVDALAIEKIKLGKARAQLELRELRLHASEVEAQWAGGRVRGELSAQFSPLPKYDLSAQMDGVSLERLPWPARWGERWGGLVSGKISLSTVGVGREELLKQLTGHAEIRLGKTEFRGWDLEQSMKTGILHTGVSRWEDGSGAFTVGGRTLDLESVRLRTVVSATELQGRIGFDMGANLTFLSQSAVPSGQKVPSPARVVRVSGSLDLPTIIVERAERR